MVTTGKGFYNLAFDNGIFLHGSFAIGLTSTTPDNAIRSVETCSLFKTKFPIRESILKDGQVT